MNIKPVKPKQDYEQAMARLEQVFNAKPGTPEGDELEILHSHREVRKRTFSDKLAKLNKKLVVTL